MSGWHQLHALFSEQQPAWQGTHCPNDGFPLLPHGGALRCPFDGWTGTSDQAMPAATTPPAPTHAAGTYGDIYTPAY